jgi:hypothetical protein
LYIWSQDFVFNGFLIFENGLSAWRIRVSSFLPRTSFAPKSKDRDFSVIENLRGEMLMSVSIQSRVASPATVNLLSSFWLSSCEASAR